MASGSGFRTSVVLARLPNLIAGLADFTFARADLADFAFSRSGLADFASRCCFGVLAEDDDDADRYLDGSRVLVDGSDRSGLAMMPAADRRAGRAGAVAVAVAMAP